MKKLRARHPLAFTIGAVVVASVILLLGQLIAGVALSVAAGFAGHAEWLSRTDLLFAAQLAGELLSAALLWLLLNLCGLSWVPSRPSLSAGKCVVTALYPLLLSGVALWANTMLAEEVNAAPAAPFQLLAFVGCMLAIGLAEEVACRGILSTTLLQHFGTTPKGVWLATVLSGVLFGLMHAVNLFGAAPFGVLVQMLAATSLGMLYTAIYFRTGSLWLVVLMHAWNDFAALAETGLFVSDELSGSAAEIISNYGVQNLITVAIYFIPVLVLLRPKKLAQIAALWADMPPLQEPPAPWDNAGAAGDAGGPDDFNAL